MLLRFRSPKPSKTSPQYGTYAAIAKVTGLAYSTVRLMCIAAQESK